VLRPKTNNTQANARARGGGVKVVLWVPRWVMELSGGGGEEAGTTLRTFRARMRTWLGRLLVLLLICLIIILHKDILYQVQVLY
jgi:hypothetical protein